MPELIADVNKVWGPSPLPSFSYQPWDPVNNLQIDCLWGHPWWSSETLTSITICRKAVQSQHMWKNANVKDVEGGGVGGGLWGAVLRWVRLLFTVWAHSDTHVYIKKHTTQMFFRFTSSTSVSCKSAIWQRAGGCWELQMMSRFEI